MPTPKIQKLLDEEIITKDDLEQFCSPVQNSIDLKLILTALLGGVCSAIVSYVILLVMPALPEKMQYLLGLIIASGFFILIFGVIFTLRKRSRKNPSNLDF